MTAKPPVPLWLGIAVVALGGALGAMLRYLVQQGWTSAPEAFPWPVFAINVAGSVVLAALPALEIVRRTPWLPLFLGTGTMGGFTTMSTAAVQSYDLRHHAVLAAAYVIGTLAAALLAVAAVDRLSTRAERLALEAGEGDE